MGQGGYLTLVNGSPFDWTAASQSAYQMNTWNWPTVPAGESAQVYVEWGDKGNIKDNGGEAYYHIAGTDDTFQVQARSKNMFWPDFHLYIAHDNLDTKTNNPGDVIDEGWRHDQSVQWILSQDAQGDWWSNSNPPVDWMQQSLSTIGNRKLRHVVMPGSHDAGMSEYHEGTVGANYWNTQTQLLNIYNQLIYGSRWFDLRPVIASGEFTSGHYSIIADTGFGGNGQNFASIIEQVNQFTATNKELIILDLSHTFNTDADYRALTQDEWNRLFEQLKGLNNRFIPATTPSDLTDLPISDFIRTSAAVVILADLPSDITLGPYASQGFYTYSQFPKFDSYANTDNAAQMATDQLTKLTTERNIVPSAAARKDTFHIFSWTLTGLGDAVVNSAVGVYDDLFARAYTAFTPESFPNVLYVDAFACRDRAAVNPVGDGPESVPSFPDMKALAMAINFGIAGRNKYVTG